MNYEKFAIDIPEVPSNITMREISVLWCVVQGMDNKEIGKYLCITPRTVKFHLSKIFEKTQTKNRTELTQKIFLMLMNSSLDFKSFVGVFIRKF